MPIRLVRTSRSVTHLVALLWKPSINCHVSYHCREEPGTYKRDASTRFEQELEFNCLPVYDRGILCGGNGRKVTQGNGW